MSLLKQKREERAALHTKLTETLKLPGTAETRSKADTMLADIEALTGDIERIVRADKAKAEIEGRSQFQPVAGGATENQAKEYRSAYAEYLALGAPGNKYSKRSMDAEKFQLLNSTRDAINAKPIEQRAQAAGSQSITYTEGSVGGYFVPAGFVYDVEKATQYFAPLLDGSVVRLLETATGNILPYPTSNDTDQAWSLVGEATQVTENSGSNYPVQGSAPSGYAGDLALGHVDFGAYKGTTGLIRVSLELMQDSAFSIEQFLTESFAQRMGRGYEYYLTNGSGVNAPTGILPSIAASGATPVSAQGSAVSDGVVGNTGANSVGYEDLVNLIHSVDPTYRRGARFMFHDTTLRHLKTRLDKFGRPLWVPGVKDNEPDTIAGYKYVINQSFPTIAASATSVAFGDFQKFVVRKVKDLQVLRLDERFADYGQIAYVAFSRIDSKLVQTGGKALNVLQQTS
jgi:HK97 family phage major capsid protein